MWKRINEMRPPEGVLVLTKIDDENGVRNEQALTLKNNLFWDNSGMYIYYTPTHWKYII
jgi:hypothetical protein